MKEKPETVTYTIFTTLKLDAINCYIFAQNSKVLGKFTKWIN